MTEPQVWTLIGVFATALFGMLTLMSTMFLRIINARFDGLSAEINGVRGEMSAEINGVRGEMNAGLNGVRGEMNAGFGGLRGEMRAEFGGLRAEMNARFEKVESQISHLDRDVQALARRVFPERD